MNKYYYFLMAIWMMYGCSLTDNDQPIPSYLVINEVDLSTTVNQGAPTHKISDVWVYADNQLIGVFEVPCRVPIIVNEETTDFLIFPGFRNNGEVSRSFIYRLMDIKEFTLPLAPGEEVEQNLTFTYQENAIFDFVEGFEGVEHIFTLNLDDLDETNVEITDETSRSGQKCGKISLDGTAHEIAAATVFSYDRSQNAGSDSYFEMDYKCDIDFVVGVIYVQEGKQVTQPLIVITPKDDWNKIYIDFTEILTSPLLETYRVYVAGAVEEGTQQKGEIFLDNLKFVHL